MTVIKLEVNSQGQNYLASYSAKIDCQVMAVSADISLAKWDTNKLQIVYIWCMQIS